MDKGLEVAVGKCHFWCSPSSGVKQILLLVLFVHGKSETVLIYTCEALQVIVLKHFQRVPVE